MGLRLLCVVAHPDDECFGFGGALALAADKGVETFVLCLTDGRAATHRGDSGSPEELGQMRREEFAASCAVLGVSRHELLDYQDGQLEFVDFSHAAGRLVKIMREYRPHVVITFGSDGGLNTHADHTMVSALTCAAYHWAASAKRFSEAGPVHHADKLYLLTTSFFMDGRPAPMPAPWSVSLDIREVLGRKQTAFAAHTSQKPLMERTKQMFEEFGHTERYLLAAVKEPRAATQETGMFDGLKASVVRR